MTQVNVLVDRTLRPSSQLDPVRSRREGETRTLNRVERGRKDPDQRPRDKNCESHMESGWMGSTEGPILQMNLNLLNLKAA